MLENIDQSWKLETIGIRYPIEQITEDDSAANHFEKGVQYVKGRHEAAWIWKNPTPPLQDNFIVASNRLQSALRRLSHGPLLLRAYETTFSEQLKSGVIEEDAIQCKQAFTWSTQRNDLL